jgi:hypothetical protein
VNYDELEKQLGEISANSKAIRLAKRLSRCCGTEIAVQTALEDAQVVACDRKLRSGSTNNQALAGSGQARGNFIFRTNL